MTTRYRIVQERVGEGGFGRVDKALDTQLERDVAIKLLDPLFKDDPTPEDIERFKREAKTLASLSHPNIPAIYDVKFSEQDNEFKIIFEWIDGMTVRDSLQQRGLMSLSEVKKWFRNICSALEHAHNKGIVHRDIKPSNLIITKDLESCYLVDFGISLRPADIQRITQGTRLGTPGYMSPEQERGEELDGRSDIYSLGIVLYECLAGNRPSVGEYTPLNTINEAVPPAIDDLIKDSISIDKAKRPRSSLLFLDRLDRALRPHSNFATILSRGALHEIQTTLTQMEPEEYQILPAGQRTLIMTRIKDLIRVDEFSMRNAVASLLSELARVSYLCQEKDYAYIVEKSLFYGYEQKYSDRWFGNTQIREKLYEVSFNCNQDAHKIISEKIVNFFNDRPNIENKNKWFYHDMRKTLQNLLANGYAAEEYVEKLGNILEHLNEISHSVSDSGQEQLVDV